MKICTFCAREGHRAHACPWRAASAAVAYATDAAFLADRPMTWLPATVAALHPLGRTAPHILRRTA